MTDPAKLPPRLRNMACELYRLGRIHKARENRLVEAGLAQVENGRAVLTQQARDALREMHK